MEPVRTIVTQEKLLPDFITSKNLTLEGVCQGNPQIFRIYKGKYNRLYQYVPCATKNGGCALGTIYNKISFKTNQPKEAWLGKVGAPEGSQRYNPETYRTRTEKAINRDTIREKLAYDFYREFGRGCFQVPKTRLSRQPLIDGYLPLKMSFSMLVITSTKNPDKVIENTLRIMSRFVEGYLDFKHACVPDDDGQPIPFIKFIEKYHRPPEQLLTEEGKPVPLFGLMETIAVGRILADTDILGGKADNAGFIWIRENGEIVSAQTVKIDPGCAFCFTHDEQESSSSPNWVINTHKQLSGRTLKDRKDFQTAQQYFPVVIHWDALTNQQKETFLDILFNTSRYLSSPDVL
ncbi:MAG: hypothetical protein ACXU9U_01630, partial [Parachlamydiaceae bacterium]